QKRPSRITRMGWNVPDAVGSKPVLIGRSVGEKAHRTRPLDGATAGRFTELAVDRDGLRLHRVLREVELLTDLSEGELGGKQREQSTLRARQPQILRDLVSGSGQLAANLVGAPHELLEV